MTEKETKKAKWPISERAEHIENPKPSPLGLAGRLEKLQAELRAKKKS